MEKQNEKKQSDEKKDRKVKEAVGKTDVKTNGKAAGKADEGTDGKAVGKADEGTDGKAAGKADEGTDGKAAEKANAETDGKAAGKADEGTDGKAVGKTDAGTDGEAAGKADAGADGKAAGKTDAGTDGKAGRKTDAKTDANTDGKAGRKADAKADGNKDGASDTVKKGKKLGNRKKRVLILSCIILVPVLFLLVIYMAGISHYRDRFLSGTVIDCMNVSGMTIPEYEEQIREYSLRVIERQADGTVLEEEISGNEIGLSYISTEPLQTILQEQNSSLWFLKRDEVYETGALPFYEEALLEERIGELKGFQKEFIQDPTDAYISDYVSGSGFELVAESQGNRLDLDKTMEAVKAAVAGMEEQVDLEEAGCYEVPRVTLEDARLQDTYAKLQNYVNVVITYTFGTEKEVLDGDTIVDWIVRDGYQVTLDRTFVEEYVASLRKKYDTIFRQRKFQTSYGAEVTIDQGDYGWWMDTGQETEELTKMLEQGESGERVPVYRQKAASYDTPDYGNSYVEINLTAQHLFLYQNGECVLESDFVSGNPSKGNETPAGIYGITYKERNATLNGENYSTPVSYWMPFNNNVGMHDAVWRNQFGGNIYRTNGSHGCINLPYSIAQEIYNYVEKGTPVICYYLPGTETAPLEDEPVIPEGESPAPEDVSPDIGTEPAEAAENIETAPEPEMLQPEENAEQPDVY